MAVPQIWMTYEELAGMLDCTVSEARDRIRLERLDRKLSRDGHKRVKLSMAMIEIFIARIQAMNPAIDGAVDDLRHIHGLMRKRDHEPRGLMPPWVRLRQEG